MRVRLFGNGVEAPITFFIGNLIGNVCVGVAASLKTPQPIRTVSYELEGGGTRIQVNGAPVPLNMSQGFATKIVGDTLRGMVHHLKGVDLDGIVRIEVDVDAPNLSQRRNPDMGKVITLIPGDGIGLEISESVVKILEAAGFRPRWESVLAGDTAVKKLGTPIPDEVIDSLSRTRIGLKGPLKTPVGTGYKSVNVTLRQHFALYVSFRPIQSLEGIETKWQGLDLVIVRENTEGLYSGIEHEVIPGVVESLKIITRSATERIARFAFDYARRSGRKKITVVHKANIMKLSDGLFLDVCRQVAGRYPEIPINDSIVDNTCMQLVINPAQFDILLLENLYGDIISDLAAGLVGGLGVVPGANYGDNCSLFEAVHGSAPDIAGKGIANPTALLRSAILMLEFLDLQTIARNVDQALRKVLREHKAVTPDLGGKATTDEMCHAIMKNLN